MSIAGAPERISLPGGGSILAPHHYATNPLRSFRDDSVALYRRLRHTLGGYQECDGLINVGRRHRFDSIDSFAIGTESGATTSWQYGKLKPGWSSFESERFPVVYQSGPLGPERVQQLQLNTTGIFRVRSNAGWRITTQLSQLYVQIWIFEKHGGLARGQEIATAIADTFAR